MYAAGKTFASKADAEGWLGAEKRLIDLDTWQPPHERAKVRRGSVTETRLDLFAEVWLERRLVRGRPLKPRTKEHYRALLRNQIAPSLGALPLRSITREKVEHWYHGMGNTTPTTRAHSYALLQAILNTALKDGLIAAHPCQIQGGGQSPDRRPFEPLTPAEIVALAKEMPQKYRLMILLAGWTGLRFGELAELRRKDVVVSTMTINVRRGVVRVDGQAVVGDTKSHAGQRQVHIPPHLESAIVQHIAEHAQPGRDGLIFPATNGGHLGPSTLYGKKPVWRAGVWAGGTNFYRARVMVGRPELRFHDLRHSAAVLAAQSGATLAELMARLGHSTPKAALRYQHAAQGRDAEIARRLSAMAGE